MIHALYEAETWVAVAFVLFLVLGFGMIGFIAKGAIKWFMAGV